MADSVSGDGSKSGMIISLIIIMIISCSISSSSAIPSLLVTNVSEWVNGIFGGGLGSIFGGIFGTPDPKFCTTNKCTKNCISVVDNRYDEFCTLDFGQNYKYADLKSQADCTVGFYKAACIVDDKYTPTKVLNKDQATTSSSGTRAATLKCTAWNYIIDSNCVDDFGAGWSLIKKDVSNPLNCTPGFGTGICTKV